MNSLNMLAATLVAFLTFGCAHQFIPGSCPAVDLGVSPAVMRGGRVGPDLLLAVLWNGGGPAPEIADFRVSTDGRIEYFSGNARRRFCLHLTEVEVTRIETIVGGAEFAAQLLDAARAEIRWDDQEAFLITSGEIEAFVIWEHLEGPILDLVVLLDSLCLEKLGPKRCWVRPGRNQPAPWAGGRS